MKHPQKTLFLLISILVFITGSPSAQTVTDSTAFELQRQRVNKLLEDRSKKFGDYNTSLEEKTGIFGLFKTKGDMQKSNDILKTIVINDNNIFIETKKLLDMKDIERERFQKMALEFDVQVAAYMKTVSKLQGENDRLRQEIKSLEGEEHNSGLIFYVLGLAIIGLLAVIYLQYAKLRQIKN